MNRVQKRDISDPMEYEKVKNVYVWEIQCSKTQSQYSVFFILSQEWTRYIRRRFKSKAYYFEQALNGVFTRQAILCTCLELKSKRLKMKDRTIERKCDPERDSDWSYPAKISSRLSRFWGWPFDTNLNLVGNYLEISMHFGFMHGNA